jgi:ADP-heptose:LPS heptosyltransferase
MSNILIIKHGSLGDIAQACGAIQDIFQNHKDDQIHLLTTKPYFELFKKNPFIHNVILDKRLSRFNLIYLYQLTRILKNFNFEKVYDLQNSSRTTFYKNILFPKAKFDKWSSSKTTLPINISKVEFDKNPVLDRFDHQLKTSGLNTLNTMKPDFSWACTNIDIIKKNYGLVEYIVLFPFCSAHLNHKKWPHYNELIKLIENKYGEQIKIVVAPGPSEIDDAKNIKAVSILDKAKALDISQLASLIKESVFVVANDTGPAHISAHLDVKGLTLFGKHTTAYKVSIERENFKVIQVDDLEKLSASKVLEKILI